MYYSNGVLLKISVALLLLLLLPFLVVAWFNNPSVDDYAFVYYTRTLGLMGAQVMWYTQWTGRYSGMFLMSLHPLLLDSLFLYKLISAVIIVLSCHVWYRFVRRILGFQNKRAALALSLMMLYVYMNGMPSLAQGFYWEVGAITYQLGSILILHFIINALMEAVSNQNGIWTGRFWINAAIVIVVCGLSETVMLLMLLVTLIFFGWTIFNKSRLLKSGLIYLFIAVFCSSVLYFAPGNYIRGNLAEGSTTSGSPVYSIYSSMDAAVQIMFDWSLSLEWLIFTVALVSLLTAFGKTTDKRIAWSYITMALLVSFGLVAASLTPGYYATGGFPPERAVNVTFWTFLVVWVLLITLLSGRYSKYLRSVMFNHTGLIVFSTVLMLYAAIDKPDNVYAAVSDLISGRAARHNTEFVEREAQVRDCKTGVCSVPFFTAFPKSVFIDDLLQHENKRYITWYADYHQKQTIIGVYKQPEEGFYRHFDFDGANDSLLGNPSSIVDSMSYSGDKSSFVPSIDGYSASYKVKMKDMDVPNIYFLGRVRIKAKVYTRSKACHTNLVFVLNTPGPAEPMMWVGQPVECDIQGLPKWHDVEIRLPLEKRHLDPENEILIYVWNQGDSEVYVDDLEIWVF